MNNEATPAESKPKHTELPWRQGRLLTTNQTRRWTEQERLHADHVEKHRIFANFTCQDNGRSRQFVAECRSLDDLEFIVRACNSHYELLDAAREALCEINKRDVDDVNRELQDKGLPDKLNVYDLNLLDRRSKAGWKLEAAIAKAEPEGEGQ